MKSHKHLKKDLSDGVFDAKNGVYDNTYGVYHGYWAKAWLNWDEYFYNTVLCTRQIS
jgi:hypothetical protein